MIAKDPHVGLVGPAHRGFYHTFPCRVSGTPLLQSPHAVLPSDRADYGLAQLNCPCGEVAVIQAPAWRGSQILVCPRCGWWHSIWFQGPRGEQELLDDVQIDAMLAHEDWMLERSRLSSLSGST